MADPTRPSWHFAPTGGGVRYGFNNAAAEHFKSGPEDKLIREVIQNSLDAAATGSQEPVLVDIFPCQIDSNDIGAIELKKHIRASRHEMKEKGQRAGAEAYRKALSLLRKPSIPALAVLDRNTTGLTEDKWNSLIFEEGIPAKGGEGAHGGSFGIGKNAPYNAAQLHSVIYCTHYSNSRQGRVEKMAGRAVLVSHRNFENDEMLQSIGFLSLPNAEPVRGTNIPDYFRLRHPGTGLWILGFNQPKKWFEIAVNATANNFFYAIHHRKLAVNIRSGADAEPDRIRHDTLEGLLDDRQAKSDTSYFYRAIRQPIAGTTKPEKHIHSFDVHINKEEDAPNRVAYVNRRGMLITATKERLKSNPFHPGRASIGWSDYAAVVIATSDETDQKIRRMENPAHDEISVSRLSEDDQNTLGKSIKQAGAQVKRILEKHLRSQEEIEWDNLKELASLFPELDPAAPGNRELKIRTIQSKAPLHDVRPANSEKDGGESDDQAGTGNEDVESKYRNGEGRKNGRGGLPNDPVPSSSSRTSALRTIQELVIMRTASNKLSVSLSVNSEISSAAHFTVQPGGEEYRSAHRIPINGINEVNPATATVEVVDDVISVTPDSGHHGHITFNLEIDANTPSTGYRFYERKAV